MLRLVRFLAPALVLAIGVGALARAQQDWRSASREPVGLAPDPAARAQVLSRPERAYDFVKRSFAARFDLTWLSPLGFQNTYAVMVTRERAHRAHLESVSDLATYTAPDAM